MATRCCNHKIVCAPPAGGGIGSPFGNLDFDSPMANLSSEVPDIDWYIGMEWSWRGGQQPPPIGSEWTANSCLGVCVSEVSQADADACAARNNAICQNYDYEVPSIIDSEGPQTGPPFIPPPSNPKTLYTNGPATCLSSCPDGTTFAYTVEAGKYIADSQILADRMAESEACRFVVGARICLGSLLSSICISSPYLSTLTPSGGQIPFDFTVVAGALPLGLDISIAANQRTMILQGTPIAGGVYNFTIRATDATGRFMQKAYTITVKGISTAGALSNATEGTAYSVVLATANMLPTLTWAVTSGALPPGLTLNTISGEISGTPDAGSAGDYTFTIEATEY